MYRQAKRKKREEAANAKILEAEKRLKVSVCLCFEGLSSWLEIHNGVESFPIHLYRKFSRSETAEEKSHDWKYNANIANKSRKLVTTN